MHQIRAHFAHKGFPLAGDVRYAPKKDATAWCGRRLFLHAAHISLFDGFSAFSPPKDDLLKPLEEELKLPEDRLEQLADPGVYQRCRSPELGVDEMEREDADDFEFSDSDSDTDVEALLEKGGLKDWDPSSTAPILAAPPRPPQPETPPEAFAEEAAAERRE
ncbi:rluA, partial [Symbiodinium sp. KB8]